MNNDANDDDVKIKKRMIPPGKLKFFWTSILKKQVKLHCNVMYPQEKHN
jgi:hypothetical protein